jgi:hypothetical protein
VRPTAPRKSLRNSNSAAVDATGFLKVFHFDQILLVPEGENFTAVVVFVGTKPLS